MNRGRGNGRKRSSSQAKGRQKGSNGPKLPRSILKELGYEEPEPVQKKQKQDTAGQGPRKLSSSKNTKLQPSDYRKETLEEGIQGELKFQASLAKKLGLRKGKTKTGPDDGLDDLLEGLEGMDGDVPADEEIQVHKPENGLPQEDMENLSDFSDESDLMGSEDEDAIDVEDVDDDSERSDEDSEEEDHQDDSPMDSTDDKADIRNKARINVQSSSVSPSNGSDSGDDDANRNSADLLHPVPTGSEAAGDTKTQRYIPPGARPQAAAAAAPCEASDPQSATTRRRIRSLLNKLATANLVKISAEIADVLSFAPQHVAIPCVVEFIMQAIRDGPRAADQFAAVTACFVVMTATQGHLPQLIANTLVALAKSLEDAHKAEDRIAASNITRLLCFMYLCGGVDSKFVYSLLDNLCGSLDDNRASLILLALQTAGPQLRSESSTDVKAFVGRVQAGAAAGREGGAINQRGRLVVDLIVAMRDSRKLKKPPRELLEAQLGPELAKALKASSPDSVTLQGVSWNLLVDGDHRGAWWIPALTQPEARAETTSSRAQDAVLDLAAKQRMNTSSRKAIFCILMTASDYSTHFIHSFEGSKKAGTCDQNRSAVAEQMDAAEKLLRLPLKGAAGRDIPSVVLHCCLQEKDWNAYYALVAAQVVVAGKQYRTSLQYAVQDRLRMVHDLNARQATNFSAFIAKLINKEALPLAVLRVLDIEEHGGRAAIFCRMSLVRLLQLPNTSDVKQVFSKRHPPQVREFYLLASRMILKPWVAELPPKQRQDLEQRIQVMEKSLQGNSSAFSRDNVAHVEFPADV